MALQKSKTLASGAVGNYWKIMSVVVNKASLKVQYIIELFADQSHSDAGAPGLQSKIYEFSFTKPQIAENLLSIGYDSIKTKAASLVSLGINGETLSSPVSFDPDLVGTTDV